MTQTAEVVPPPLVQDSDSLNPGSRQRQQQPPWWKHKTEGFKPRGFKPRFSRRVNTTPTGCYRCGEEGHFVWECMSEHLPAVPRTDVPVQQQQQVAAPTSPESGNGGGMLRGPRGEPPLWTVVHTFSRHQGVRSQTECGRRNAARHASELQRILSMNAVRVVLSPWCKGGGGSIVGCRDHD